MAYVIKNHSSGVLGIYEDTISGPMLAGFSMRGGDRLFSISRGCPEIPGLENTNADAHFRRILKARADCGLEEFCTKNLRRTQIYGSLSFWKSAVFNAGRPEPNDDWLYIGYGGIEDGIVRFSRHGIMCAYDIFTGDMECKIIAGTGKRGRTVPPDAVNCFYGSHKNQLLAQRQIETGAAPAAYRELARINSFMEDKMAVSAVFQNGAVARGKSPRVDVTGRAAYLLRLWGRRFCLNQYYFPARTAGELTGLRYRKQTLEIDGKSLQNF